MSLPPPIIIQEPQTKRRRLNEDTRIHINQHPNTNITNNIPPNTTNICNRRRTPRATTTATPNINNTNSNNNNK